MAESAAPPCFMPIAIIGRACVLPGALSPEALWSAVAAGRDLTGAAPAGLWGIPKDVALCASDGADSDRAWSDRGGYVWDFESVWNAEDFAMPAEALVGLDPLVHWSLHCAREALRDAGVDWTTSAQNIGAIFGNLGFPSPGMVEHAVGVWMKSGQGDARNRAMSGGTAAILAEALQLKAGSFSVDAACASSLYAIALACEQLADGRADLMLAGAVQGSDDLFLHIGFSALNALSRSGQSRPFHRDADGLIPAQGAAFVALKRLDDAVRDGDRIHGVIRGIGLSNDGRGKGLLAPSEEGQRRAMAAAFAMSGLSPSQVSLLECHATGTSVGDATELRSSAAIYADVADLPIASLKSNLGHLITTAGVAGLIKVLESMRHGQRAPSLQVEAPSDALLATPFRVLKALEDWPTQGARTAAVSAFGFGGNNAHLLVQSYEATASASAPAPKMVDARVAIVGIGCLAAAVSTRLQFVERLMQPAYAGEHRVRSFALDLDGLRFPPSDLSRALPQQLSLLHCARDALRGVQALARDRSAIYVGMEPDVEVARYGLRWRNPDLADSAKAAIISALDSAAVVGCMPNIPANRLSSQFDLAGPAFTVQSGAASGAVAMRLAARALTHGQIDTALVGAVDFACEDVQRSLSATPPGDAAVLMVLKRESDAVRDGDIVLAIVGVAEAQHLTPIAPSDTVTARFGDVGAAGAALEIASAAMCLHLRRHIGGRPWLAHSPRQIEVQGFRLAECLQHPPVGQLPAPRLRCFSGADRAGVLQELAADRESDHGRAKLVLVASDAEMDRVRTRAIGFLKGHNPAGTGIHFQDRPMSGELAFCFAGAGASYHGMGEPLLTQLPSLLHGLGRRSRRLCTALDWAFDDTVAQPTATQQLWGASALSQLHLELTREVLGLRANAWMGYSSGETNALFGAGIWTDADELMEETEQSGLMSHALGGEFAAVQPQWPVPVRWASWTVLAPIDQVRAAIAELGEASARVHVAIIQSDEECLIAGDAQACARVVAQIGVQRCVELIYPLAVHVPELRAVASEWARLHHRQTHTLDDSRIYSNAFGRAYAPTREQCAQAILDQATDTLDLRPAVLSAWKDGVRIFIEHGPGNAYGRAIRNILGDREALVVSLDRKGQGFEATLNALAALKAAGVPMRLDRLAALMPFSVPAPLKRPITISAHPPAIDWAELSNLAQGIKSRADAPSTADVAEVMAPAPVLPSVLAVQKPKSVIAIQAATPLQRPSATLAISGVTRFQTPAAAPIAAQAMQLSRIHRAFIAGQASVHAQFLASRESALRRLRAASAGIDSTSPPSAPAKHLPSLGSAPIVAESQDPPSLAEEMTPAKASTKTALAAPVSPVIESSVSGQSFTREQLIIHSSGKIREIFGARFGFQDAYARQVRMPQPPLLLADRVIGLKAEPMSMGKGTIWTETDVSSDSWYLHQGRMPAGVMIEAGQADLMLISWLGVDQHNRGERVYRLLGCELTYHGDLPKAGYTLRFDIHLDAHAAQGDVRLMFFHYDCINGNRPQLSVRSGQAGFFTDAELDASAGCIWSPQTQSIVKPGRVDAPVALPQRRAFGRVALEAFAAGNTYACFGAGFERAQTHTQSPAIHGGKMLLLDRVSDFDATGGPWQRGYLRAEFDIHAQQWFFDGHFKNDPCMPGTLMFEGCLQALSVYLAACGHSLTRDGWRFQPVPELPYQLQCRGQVTPNSRLLITEVFVEEIIAGPVPFVFADLLCTVDGRKAFHARRVGLQLVPDWPMESWPAEASEDPEASRAVVASNGFRFDHRSLLACALGRPSRAFGAMYTRFDGPERVARLPSPPYLFVSRVLALRGEPGVMKAGAQVTMEYQIPSDAWYFAENGARVMPFAVLLEAALQPCGWLSSYVGSTLTVPTELGFRNLDGEAELLGELGPEDATLITEVELTEVSATAGMIIESFAVTCRTPDREIYRLRTVFGFFPLAALAAQAGLATTADQREWLARPSDFFVDLSEATGIWKSPNRPRIAGDRLRMIDRVDGYWPDAGAAGLGQMRAVKTIDSDEWFFKAHFFQDPVQPGSLGLEAMVQLLQFYLLEKQLDRDIVNPRFESLGLGTTHRWKYRGQVLPHHRLVHTTLEVTQVKRDKGRVMAIATASLWADGQRIYEAQGLSVRIVPALAEETAHP